MCCVFLYYDRCFFRAYAASPQTSQTSRQEFGMKYIYYIILIASVVTLGIGLSLKDNSVNQNDFALAVNDRHISPNELQARYDERSAHLADKDEFLETIIMKELLIQEAKRLKIDQEEPFRRSIQNFYEQSLTKILMDRKFRELNENVSQKEIDRYIELLGSDISITLSRQPTTATLQDPANENREKLRDTFDNFSTQIKMQILPLAEGESSPPVLINREKAIITLDAVQARLEDMQPLTANVREIAEKNIMRYKREQAIKMWLDGLRQKATIANNWK